MKTQACTRHERKTIKIQATTNNLPLTLQRRFVARPSIKHSFFTPRHVDWHPLMKRRHRTWNTFAWEYSHSYHEDHSCSSSGRGILVTIDEFVWIMKRKSLRNSMDTRLSRSTLSSRRIDWHDLTEIPIGVGVDMIRCEKTSSRKCSS